MKSATLRKRFRQLAVGDMLKAAEAGALAGCVTLAVCILDYLAYLRPKAEGEGENYRALVADYLPKIDSKYNPRELFALRCSMVHTFAESRAFAKAKLSGFLFTYCQPNRHLSRPAVNALSINIDSFVADVVWATHLFFSDVDGDAGVEERANGLIVVSSGMSIVDGYDDWGAARLTYASMHEALRELDADAPDLTRLRADVAKIFSFPPVAEL